MGGRHVADIRHAWIALAALNHRLWRRHAPSRHHKLTPLRCVAHDRREVVGEDAGERRHVANIAAHRPSEVADRLRTLREAVQVAHAGEYAAIGYRAIR